MSRASQENKKMEGQRDMRRFRQECSLTEAKEVLGTA